MSFFNIIIIQKIKESKIGGYMLLIIFFFLFASFHQSFAEHFKNYLFGDYKKISCTLQSPHFSRIISSVGTVYLTNQLGDLEMYVEGEENILDAIRFFVHNDTLYIQPYDPTLTFMSNFPINIYINRKDQEHLSLGGSASYIVDDGFFNTSKCKLELFNKASVSGDINVNELELDMKHESKTCLSGEAKNKRIRVFDKAECNVEDLRGTIVSLIKKDDAKIVI